MNRRFLAALLGGCMLSAACFDLDVPTIQPTGGTTYTRAELIANPVLMERLVAGTFVLAWAAVREGEPWLHFSVYGEEATTSATSIGGPMFEIIKEPRGEVPNFLGVDHSVMRNPWHLFYETNSSAAEFGGLVRREGIKVIDPATGQDNTQRFLAFARFIQGMSHMYIGLVFDSGAVVHEGIDLSRPTPLPLTGYREVIDSAVKWLGDCAEISETNSFAFPLNEGQWIFRTGFDNVRLAQLCHSYAARALVYSARTPEEREAVDWDLVKEHLAKSIKADFGPRGLSASGGGMQYKQIMSSAPIDPPAPDIICNGECTSAGVMRVDTRIVGPADTSGNYQTWLEKVSGARFDTVGPISVETPDQRIQAVGNQLPNVKPTFFKHTDLYPTQASMDTALRGKYYVSFYWSSSRARNNHTQFPVTGGGNNENDDLQNVQDYMMMKEEMDLLLAEAHIRSSTPDLAAAATLINLTREINGELPPVTAAGVPASAPGAPCVPRRYDGTCGSLMDALQYEKRIETWATGIAFFDLRGWGCLLEGTPLHLAPPGTQLDLLGKQIYTYGGTTGPTRGAVKPTNCPLLHRP